MEKTKKLSLDDLKAKAGQAFIDANAINGGTLADCHVGTGGGSGGGTTPIGPVSDAV